MNNKPASGQLNRNFLQRVRLWYGLLLVICAVFVIRLFYLQVIRHNYYVQAARSDQLKEYEIPAERGVITAHDGDQLVPLVLNEQLYSLIADPKFVTDPTGGAKAIAGVIGGQATNYEKQLRASNRYQILAKKLSKEQKQKLDNLKLKGVGTVAAEYRTYPEGALAAQLLGYVNADGNGTYGLEQALNKTLSGTPGQLKAVTDAAGVPLAANKDNVQIAPKNGRQVVLTVDVAMQRQLEDILKTGLDNVHSSSGSALILDTHSGAVKAMANYPTYNPGEYYKVSDASVFSNAVVSSPLEIGSVMKTLTASAAIDQGVVTKDTTYYDPSHFAIDGAVVKNIEEDGGAGTRSVTDILTLSLNTGATWLLMQMGGGQINAQARNAWHDYMVNHYHFGQATGIEQGYEADGTIPDPNQGYGLNIQYANTAFGQGMTATPLQLGAAVTAVLNDGTYYTPHLVEGYVDSNGREAKQAPQIWKQGIVKPGTSSQLKTMMEAVVNHNYTTYKMAKPATSFSVGGKTGTAQIAKPGGGYYDDRFNGTFVGFVGGDKPEYVIVVRVNDPHIGTYAGAGAAAPIFGKLANLLINNFGVTPKS